MNEKRILEVAYPALNNSGVPSVIMGIVRGLHKDIKFDALVFRNDIGYYEKEFRSFGGTIFTINCEKQNRRSDRIIEKLSRPWRLFWGTRKILKQNNYEAIHCHNGWDSGWCLLAAKTVGIKKRIAHSHGSKNPFENGLFIFVYHLLMRFIINMNSTTRIGCSRIAAKNLYGKKNAIIILNAVDTNRFNINNFQRTSFDPKRPKFIFVGRLSLQKNPFFMFDIFKNIQNKLPGASLKIIGFGEYVEMLESKIQSYGLQKCVEMLSHDTDVARSLADSDIFILPSYWEGLPIVLIEAQIMLVHCFASDSIANEANLGMCDYLSIGEGAEKWSEFIIDYINHKNINEKIDDCLLEKYSWGKIICEYREVYSEA